ncbi:hypothetical protein PSACC_01038 [Paramicrosporidium saccamoebae]|uniref:Uncharacterized protein n=1 Tax=Paramicrosporidium saccamoebae TaxID=1246581 RepID=A0A2H9TN83_9FUNG|nr:hypothetical protein PSACC_01038 [Paramicrosporidium saccamoebae]
MERFVPKNAGLTRDLAESMFNAAIESNNQALLAVLALRTNKLLLLIGDEALQDETLESAVESLDYCRTTIEKKLTSPSVVSSILEQWPHAQRHNLTKTQNGKGRSQCRLSLDRPFRPSFEDFYALVSSNDHLLQGCDRTLWYYEFWSLYPPSRAEFEKYSPLIGPSSIYPLTSEDGMWSDGLHR